MSSDGMSLPGMSSAPARVAEDAHRGGSASLRMGGPGSGNAAAAVEGVRPRLAPLSKASRDAARESREE